MPVLTANQVEDILEEIKEDQRIQGILLTGSYVYGQPNDKSDLDVRCVTNDGSNWTEWKRMRFGVVIETFFNPPDRVREFMRSGWEEGDSSCIHFWANGKIIFDPNGIMKELQEEARQLWKKGSNTGVAWKEYSK